MKLPAKTKVQKLSKGGGVNGSAKKQLADIKKGEPLPQGAVMGVAPGAGTLPSGKIIDENGKVVGYYNIPEAAPSGQQFPTSQGPIETPEAIATKAATAKTTLPPTSMNQVERPMDTARFKERLAEWKSEMAGKGGAKAQHVPSDIANYMQNVQKPYVQKYQKLLDVAVAKKYGQPGGPVKGQQLSRAEAEAAIGKDNYAKFLEHLHAYEDYRADTKGSYDTQNVTWGATDRSATGAEQYGFRMSNQLKNTAEQSAVNKAKTSKDVLDWQKNPDLKKLNEEVAKKVAEGPSVKLLGPNNESIAPMQYEKNPDGTDKINPATGKRIPIIPDVSSGVPGGFAGGGIIPKRGKYQKKAGGGPVDMSSMTAEQQAAYNSFTPEQLAQFNQGTPEQQSAMLTPAGATGLTGTQKAIASIAPIAGTAASSIIDNNVKVDPTSIRQNVGKDAASMALKRAGQATAIGLNPALMAATGGTSAIIAPIAGLAEGAIEGGLKGKKKAQANIDQANQEAVVSAADATHALAEGGPIEGAGTAKSDSIKAEIKAGSFVVPAENATAAERLRKMYLKDTDSAKLNQGGGVPVKLSNGEHLFSPDEVSKLKARGVNLDALAPNQEGGKYGLQKGGTVGYKDGGGVKDMTDAELKKKRDELKAEYDALSGPGENLAERSMLQVAKEKELKEYDSEIADRERAKVDNSFNPKPVKAPEGQNAQAVLDTAFSDPNVGKDNAPATTTEKQKPSTTTQKSSGAETAPSATTQALQQAFLKEHGGIGSQSPVTETSKVATSTETIANLKDAYDKAETLADTESIRKQMHDLGYNTDGTPIMGNAKTPAEQAQVDATTTIEGDSGEAPAPAASSVEKVFKSLGGAGGLMAIGQIGLGVAFGAKGKLPIDHVDPQLLQAQQKALQQATFGFSPEQMALSKGQIETNRRDVVGNINQMTGGNAGAGIANTRLATLDANQASLGLAIGDQAAKQQKQAYADMLTGKIAEANRQIFVDKLNQYSASQQVAGNLVSAGISNLVGATQMNQQQNRMDERAKKYPIDPWSTIIAQQNNPAGQP